MLTHKNIESILTSDLRAHTQEAMESEILDSVLLSQYPQFELAQLAKSYGVPAELVDQIAQSVVKRRTGHDLESIQFQQIVQQIQKLELEEPDAGLREWKIQSLARRVKRTPKQLMQVYNKALTQQAIVKPMSVREFREMQGAETEWLIQGWIPKGTTLLLHADGGVGKTLFTYQIMESVVSGQPWNGYQVCQGGTLLVQVDEPSLVTAERIDIRGIADDAPLAILSDWQVEQMAALESHIEETKPALVIVDSLTAINRNCIFSENDTEYARPILQLAAIASKHKCSIVVIHHSNAEGQSRGTRAIHNSVSEVWGLSAEGISERILRVQKTRMGRPPGRYRFAFDEADFTFTYQGEDNGTHDPEASVTQEERVRLWLGDTSQRGIRFSTQEISERLNIASHSARRLCYELWAKGLIKRDKPKGERFYLYYVGDLTKLCSEKSDQEVIRQVRKPESKSGKGLTGKWESDQQKTENLTVENEQNSFSLSHLEPKAKQDRALTSDQTSEKGSEKADQLSTESDHLPEVGDIVIANGSATLYRASSDKLPWQAVPRQLRNKSEIPVKSLDTELFHELTAPSKVLTISKDGKRVKVRNQETGRTTVFKVSDLNVLQASINRR